MPWKDYMKAPLLFKVQIFYWVLLLQTCVCHQLPPEGLAESKARLLPRIAHLTNMRRGISIKLHTTAHYQWQEKTLYTQSTCPQLCWLPPNHEPHSRGFKLAPIYSTFTKPASIHLDPPWKVTWWLKKDGRSGATQTQPRLSECAERPHLWCRFRWIETHMVLFPWGTVTFVGCCLHCHW